jgi:hypothetical protein
MLHFRGQSHAAFFVHCAAAAAAPPPTRRLAPPPEHSAQLATQISRHRPQCSCVWVRLQPVCLVVPGTDLR